MTERDYDQVMDVNLKAAFFASQAMVQQLRQNKRPGRIINISSVHEDLPFPGFASYCASKGGIRMLTRNLAVELRAEVYNRDTEEFRPLTPQELDAVAFSDNSIPLRGEDGEIVAHDAPNGSFFTVRAVAAGGRGNRAADPRPVGVARGC